MDSGQKKLCCFVEVEMVLLENKMILIKNMIFAVHKLTIILLINTSSERQSYKSIQKAG